MGLIPLINRPTASGMAVIDGTLDTGQRVEWNRSQDSTIALRKANKNHALVSTLLVESFFVETSQRQRRIGEAVGRLIE